MFTWQLVAFSITSNSTSKYQRKFIVYTVQCTMFTFMVKVKVRTGRAVHPLKVLTVVTDFLPVYDQPGRKTSQMRHSQKPSGNTCHRNQRPWPQLNNKFSKEYKYLVIAYINNRDGRKTKFWRPHSSISSKLLFCVSMRLNALKIIKYKIITAVLPQHVSPFLRNYRDLRSHPHGVSAVTAVLPWSPSPCSSLIGTSIYSHMNFLRPNIDRLKIIMYIHVFQNKKKPYSLGVKIVDM